jgi:hypothetical protein
MTQFGRGGGASTSPCGWYVVYAHEQPSAYNSVFSSTATTGLGINEGVYPTGL